MVRHTLNAFLYALGQCMSHQEINKAKGLPVKLQMICKSNWTIRANLHQTDVLHHVAMAFLMWSREPWNWICCAFRPCTRRVLGLWVKQGELHPSLPCPSAKDRTWTHALPYKPPTEKWGCQTTQALIFLKTAFHSPLVSVWLTAIQKTMHLLGLCCLWLPCLHCPCSSTCAGRKILLQ